MSSHIEIDVVEEAPEENEGDQIMGQTAEKKKNTAPAAGGDSESKL